MRKWGDTRNKNMNEGYLQKIYIKFLKKNINHCIILLRWKRVAENVKANGLLF